MSSIWRNHLCFVASLIVLLLVSVTANVQASGDGKNVLNNGNFRVGSGNSVDGWRTDAWVQDPGVTDYLWHRPENGQPGEMEVFSHRENDARWSQPIELSPGWYHISADVRAVDVQPFRTGANISVLEDGIASRDLRGTTGWQRIGFYLKVGGHGADVEVALRLGGYGQLTRGEAFFRNATVERVAGPSLGERSYDLTAVRKAAVSAPVGKLWTLVATYLFLLILAFVGWRLMDEPRAAADAVADERPERRRRASAR